MRTIERTRAFHRDWKKVGSGVHGEWADHRECHLRPDLLLIYRKPNPETLQLVRLGSHSELFG